MNNNNVIIILQVVVQYKYCTTGRTLYTAFLLILRASAASSIIELG